MAEPTAASKPCDEESPETARRRTGKIARLPRELRDLINLMLRDGATYSQVIKKLAQRGHDLNVDNLSRWHAHGYQDWLQDQAWLEEMRLRLDFATDVVQQSNGATLDAASLRIAVTRMYSLLTNFDPGVLKSQLATQPGAYSRILNVLCKLTDSALRCERQRLDQANNDVWRSASTAFGSPLTSSSLIPHPPPSTTNAKLP
jgi:hypothetical protein